MPRLNIEDSFWSDLRLVRLSMKLDDPFRAIGMLAVMWNIGQRHWAKGELIPEDEWKRAGLSDEIITCGWAERLPDGKGIYVRGAKAHFDWLQKRHEAGRLGGHASIDSKRAAAAQADRIQEESSKSKHEQPSYSFSSSISEEEKHTVRESDLEEIYRLYPKRPNQRKKQGLQSLASQVKTAADLIKLKTAVETYSRYVAANVREDRYIKRFETFAQEWREWANQPLVADYASTKVVKESEDV